MGIPTKVADFDSRVLWAKADFRPIFANQVTAETRARQFGVEPGQGARDDGMLRVKDGVWEIFSTGFSGSWNLFDPDDIGQRSHADHFSRYGAGWSMGGVAFTGHGPTHLVDALTKLLGHTPDAMDIADASYGRWPSLLDVGAPPPEPQPPVVAPSPPVVVTPAPPRTEPPPVQPPNPPVIKPPAVPSLDKALGLARQLVTQAQQLVAELEALKKVASGGK